MNIMYIDKYEFYYELGVYEIEELEKYIELRGEPVYNKLLEYSSEIKDLKKVLKQAINDNVDVESIIKIETLY